VAVVTVEIFHDADLVAVLDALGASWTNGRPENGARATIRVEMDGELDGRLERLVDDLSRLRWAYTPGRTLQLELPGWPL
jgi:hypothetical protein